MIKNRNLQKVLIVAVFSLFFMTAGWLIPAMYAAHAPADWFIEQNSFQTNNISTSAETHTFYFDRTVKTATTGTVYTELYLVSAENSSNRIEIQSRAADRYFEKGRTTIEVDVTIPADIEAGKYYYERTYEMRLAEGRITRTFAFDSDPFYVKNEIEEPP